MSAPVTPRVLVIEDNPLNLELVKDLLEASGWEVRQARTAEEGLRVAQNTLPDVILMDLSLPGMDGLAATRALRANPAIRHLPVIALTAHAMQGDRERCLAAGMDDYLTKPIQAGELDRVLQRYLHQ